MTHLTKQPPLLFLLTTAFLFSIGMTLVFPVLPFIVMQYVADVRQQPVVIGALGAVFALCAFLSGPVMGALSDAYGRRPVLILSLLGSAVGYVMFGIGGSLLMLFAGRIIDGLTAGGMSAMFGFIADTTRPEERGKVFGQVGAVVGAGFIIGPALGGLLSHLSLSAPMYAAAAVCLLNMAWGYFVLPESRARQAKHFDLAHLNPFAQLGGALAYPEVRRLVTVSVLFSIPFSIMSVSMALLARDILHWGPAQASTAYMIVGVCDILAQGFLLPHLIRWLGEKGVAQLGLGVGLVGLIGYAALPAFPSTPLLYLSVLLFATGEGIFTATQGALLSLAAPGDEQGRVQGGAQAFGALAQIVGPLSGGQLYARLGPSVTFGTGAALVLVALGVLTGSRGASGKGQEAEVSG